MVLTDGQLCRYGRVFHPQIILHLIIKNLIIFEITNKNLVDHSQEPLPLIEPPMDTCPIESSPSEDIMNVPGWNYDGCYTDDWERTLPVAQPASTAMTPSVCAGLCSGHRFFGVQNGNECFCGDERDAGRLAPDPESCSVACTGEPGFVCGGGWRLSIYRRTPPEVQQVAGWEHVSCVRDAAEPRTLSGASFTEAGMTAERCSALCCGWRHFGVSYGTECHCGNDVAAGLEAPAADCDMSCGGDSGVACGAGWRLNLYRDLPGDAPNCASSCSVRRSCTQNNCNGGFSLETGLATCSGAFQGCPCEAGDQTCGPPQSCDMNQCAGTFDADGYATCKGFFRGCRCTATGNTCGARRSCDADNCAGSFDLANGKAYCTRSRSGCECQPTDGTCGPPQNCHLGNCQGRFSMEDGQAYCSAFFQGCRCMQTQATCGAPQSCDANRCNGGWDDNGVARCRDFFRGCQCTPTLGTCGAQQSCDNNNCWGTFDLDDGRAYCRGWFAGCQCLATDRTCGQQQSCDANGCNGQFDLGNGLAYCSGKFAGCRCDATDRTCGQQQSCDANSCDGGYGADGVARCRDKFAGCRCLPSANTCGQQQSCDDNGCNGGWDANGVARCQSNFAGCLCRPTDKTCGQAQRCSAGGCDGVADGTGQGYCRGRYAGCRCNADTSTPGYCHMLVPCSTCQGVDVGQSLGRCRTSSHYDCTCVLPPKPPPPPPPPPPTQYCRQDCLAISSQLIRLPDYVCTNDRVFPYGSGASGKNGGLDWYKIGAIRGCELSLAKQGVSHTFPEPFCRLRLFLSVYNMSDRVLILSYLLQASPGPLYRTS